ncbi:MAG: FAD-binding oxidoreductase [Actinomycetota bacterium]|nr:FAD-binding oxidoreductase [Actinomycetota bacterium]
MPGPTEADVVIVGAGFTGLWTAYHLSRVAPDCRVTVLEAEVAGFGASGRNGGWCSALFPVSTPALSRRYGRDATLRMARAMQATVREVGAIADAEGIDAHYDRGGTVVLARTPVQLRRAGAEVAASLAAGLAPEDLQMLDAATASAQLAGSGVLGGTFTPHCAAIHPARLVRGLARLVESRGVRVHERTPVRAIEAGCVRTDAGDVRAEVVVRATEGYTPSLPGHGRKVAPVYSLMVATEPLPETSWVTLGLDRRQTFSDGRHLVIYGQRTRDGRIAFGGRGAPYHFGSAVRPEHDRDPDVFAALRATLRELLPQLRDVAFTHAWGGPLAVPRDWHASVGLDRATGLAWAGGYVGDGVGTSHLAGATLADLIAGRDTDLVDLPWVGHRSRSWEPEPLRWLGINAGLRAMTAADAEESVTGRTSLLARAVSPLLGGH